MGRHENEHLRRFLLARKAGDPVEMRRWWEELVIDFRDRMDGLVAVNHMGRLDDLEHEDAVQRAMTRFSQKLIHTFHGTSMGELVNATKALCRFACMDVQQEAVAYRERHRSIDEGWGGTSADEDRPNPAWEVDAARAAYESDEAQGDTEAFLDWAVPQLLDKRRAVFERTRAGLPLAEICEELDLSRDNAYQLRSRALKDLGKLYQQYDS